MEHTWSVTQGLENASALQHYGQLPVPIPAFEGGREWGGSPAPQCQEASSRSLGLMYVCSVTLQGQNPARASPRRELAAQISPNPKPSLLIPLPWKQEFVCTRDKLGERLKFQVTAESAPLLFTHPLFSWTIWSFTQFNKHQLRVFF